MEKIRILHPLKMLIIIIVVVEYYTCMYNVYTIYIHVHFVHVMIEANGVTQDSHYLQRKELNCPEQDLNPLSPAYMAGTLTTKPPRQLSGRGTNPGI